MHYYNAFFKLNLSNKKVHDIIDIFVKKSV